MNLPNKLTIARIFMVPLILIFMLPMPESAFFQHWNTFVVEHGFIVALFLFGIASLTDMLDGKIARSRNLVTNFGKFLDPIADKLLVISVLTALVQVNRISAYVVIIVIIREFVVTGIRLLASDKGVVISASNLGKAKTLSQIIAILFLLAEKIIINLIGGVISAEIIVFIGNVIVFAAVVLTIVSGYDYLKKNLLYLKA